jgi:hypothetical protein
MTTYSYTLTEYNVDEPWLIASTARDSVELDDGEDFYAWAHEHWPSASLRREAGSSAVSLGSSRLSAQGLRTFRRQRPT